MIIQIARVDIQACGQDSFRLSKTVCLAQGFAHLCGNREQSSKQTIIRIIITESMVTSLPLDFTSGTSCTSIRSL